MAYYPQIPENGSQEAPIASEQLHLPFHDEEGGIPPLRLLEPIASLNLTPFAAKAARGTGVATVGELAAFVFDPSKECRGLGQGHIDEIRRKIEQFVGRPPYAREKSFDIASLLRLSLCDIEVSQRALIVTRCKLQEVVPLFPQESREAENTLLKDKEAFAKLAIAICEVPAKDRASISTKPIVTTMGEERSKIDLSRHEQSAVASFAKASKDRKFQECVEKARVKASTKILSILDTMCCGLIQPWMRLRGGIAHEQEILMFITDQESFLAYSLVEKSLALVQLITGSSFLFSHSLCHVEGKIWAVSSQEQARAKAILQDAKTLIGKGKEGVCLQALAAAVKKSQFEQWEACSAANIERLLFWYFSLSCSTAL